MRHVQTSPVRAPSARQTAQRTKSRGITHLVTDLSSRGALDLVVGFVHDARSPLTSILALSESLLHGRGPSLNDAQKREVGLIYGAALGLSTLAADVVDLAEGGGELTKNGAMPFSLAELFESVTNVIRPIAHEKGLDLRTVTPANDLRVGHRPVLNRVLLNLATNALKFTNEGHVEIAATELIGGGVRFSVHDTGPGLDSEDLEALMHPFRRSRMRSNYVLSPTGFGLTTCKRLLAVMGSKLEVETRVDWGTRFHFALDLPCASRTTA
jgi:signal transduction histidine kinase